MKTIQFDNADGIVTLCFDEPGSPVNTMCAAWRDDLATAVSRIVALGPQLRGVLLTSAKSTFFAGADLKATMRMQRSDGPAMFAAAQALKAQFRTLERLGKPVVSCLNGSALGGGWEVALIGHHRVALDEPKSRYGLPEVTLGLLPGASGITKMVRLLGLERAQPYLLEGKTFDAQEGARLGLIHELAADAAQLREKALAWIAAHPQAAQPWDEPGYKIPGGTPSSPSLAMKLSAAPALLRQKTQGLYPAAEYALSAMVEGAQLDFDTALRVESRYLARLIESPVTRNMINTFFFDLNAVKGGRSRPAGPARFHPTKVGVLGAGLMGAGIAGAQARSGITTVLLDVSLAKAEQGKQQIQKSLAPRPSKTGAADAAATERAANALALIMPTERYEDLAGCDLIVEAVFEQRELKGRVIRQAREFLAADGVMASNTSTLPIGSLATVAQRPERFVGIHFFSPVEKMQLVEIIRGPQTSDDTLARAYDYVRALGKLPIVVNDSRGFYTSRTFGAFVVEGANLLAEGLPAALIENLAVQAGMPVGPLAVMDETALSLMVHILEQTQADLRAQGQEYALQPGEQLVQRMVHEFKRPGRSGGGGFYDYPAGAPKHLWPGLRQRFEKPGIQWDAQEIKDRLLYRQAIETGRCLAEGVLTHVHDANIGSIFGIGFPAWTGGAMQFIYGTGIDAFIERAAQLAALHGPRFALSEPVVACTRQHEPRY